MRSITNIGAEWRRPLLLVVTALFLVGFAGGCGGDEDGESPAIATTSAATSTDTAAQSNEAGEGAASEASDDEAGDRAASEGGDRRGGSEGTEGDASGPDSSSGTQPAPRYKVPPYRHKDSGGGSKQFRQPGGDNSVQDSGQEADRATFVEVAAVVHAFLDAQAAGNVPETCKYLSSDLVGQLLELAKQSDEIEQTCAAVVEALTGPVPAKARRQIAKADIGSVRVDGDHGFVLYRGPEKGVYVMPIVRENGQWRISALAGSILY